MSVHPAGVDVVRPLDARLGGEGDPGGLDGHEVGGAVLQGVARLPGRHVVELGRLEGADQLEEDDVGNRPYLKIQNNMIVHN